jgi:hypothetical protein
MVWEKLWVRGWGRELRLGMNHKNKKTSQVENITFSVDWKEELALFVCGLFLLA